MLPVINLLHGTPPRQNRAGRFRLAADGARTSS